MPCLPRPLPIPDPFGGFSLGAVTTWYQFIHNLDYIKYFVPMSGDCWIMGTYGGLYQPVETVDYLEQVVSDGGWSEDDFYLYQGIGTSDPSGARRTARSRRC